MAWIVSGNGQGVEIGISNSGFPYVSGFNASHNMKPPEVAGSLIDWDVMDRINSAQCVWNIGQTTDEDDGLFSLVGGDLSFLEKVRANPGRGIAAIQFFIEPDAVGLTVALPESSCKQAFDLLKLVLSNPSLGYRFNLGFSGFPFPVADFVAGGWESPYVIMDEVAFGIRHV